MDTGYTFRDPKTQTIVRVIAKQGESVADAVARVRADHGLGPAGTGAATGDTTVADESGGDGADSKEGDIR